MYKIGKITNTHGIKGEVKVYNLSDFDRFLVGKKVYVLVGGQKHFFTIERVRESKNLLIIAFEGYADINLIEPFKSMDLYTDEDINDALEADEYHYEMLIDKDLYDTHGLKLGVVKNIVFVPQGHLLEVQKEDGKMGYVPFVNAFVKEILADRIIIETIEGLL